MISRGFFFSGVGNIELSTRRQTFIQRRYCKIFSEPGEINSYSYNLMFEDMYFTILGTYLVTEPPLLPVFLH